MRGPEAGQIGALSYCATLVNKPSPERRAAEFVAFGSFGGGRRKGRGMLRCEDPRNSQLVFHHVGRLSEGKSTSKICARKSRL